MLPDAQSGNFRTQSSGQERINARAALEPGSIRLELCGRKWAFRRPNDLESLWEAVGDDEFASDERLPYWVEIWPASLALAVWLQEHKERIAGKVCLDLGCGLGFTALVGAWFGARVFGMDYELAALSHAAANAALNGLAAPGGSRIPPAWAAMDWRKPALRARSCDIIWGGDVMYEKRFVAPVFACIDHALAKDGVVWIAEPGRVAYEDFERTLLTSGWRSRCVARKKVEPLYKEQIPVSVALWELSRV
jgi:predicted nicotinamide N-methyase